ncbi:hypothetical protein MMC19_004071 [Ptychographa xylographoides]|nr:hypothetical protein [Ptychographa xylographoides]
MTPPPSTQVPKHHHKSSRLSAKPIQSHLVTPPATLKIGTGAGFDVRLGNIPTIEQTRELPEAQLRDMVVDLLAILGEARITAAHAKLQHSLLSIEIVEVAQRATVEHEMMRRELEVLQATSPMLRARPVGSFASPTQGQTRSGHEAVVKHGRMLESENLLLQRRLKQAKKIIKHLDGKNTRLEEGNELLRQRIKQNREHADAMRSSAALRHVNLLHTARNESPQHTRSTHPASIRTEGQDPIHALLFAGQVLSGETTSVPSTPTHPRPIRFHPGHTRGTHSLSSLPMTPVRSRPMTADHALSTPVEQVIPTSHISFSAPSTQFVTFQDEEERRADRDSTISASGQEEEALTDEDIPASQASQVATNMLLRYPGPKSDGSPKRYSPDRASLTQRKLIGKAIKARHNLAEHGKKRAAQYSDSSSENRSRKLKVMKEPEQMGLGIAVWPSPSV